MNRDRILILGATSAIAQAYARQRATEGASFVLAGRHAERLQTIASDLRARGAAATEIFTADLADLDGIESDAGTLRSRFGDPDEILLAYGIQRDQTESEVHLAAAREMLETGFTSVILWILALLRNRDVSARLNLVVIGSVAGDRGRASNFIYGAAKAGLDQFLEGLRQRYSGTMVHVVTVKPGFVDTPMTAHMDKRGPLWATPDRIAADIDRAVRTGRQVIYTPWFWWPIMFVIRHLPWFVFKRLKI
jgi:short-subunit dehydrogenase